MGEWGSQRRTRNGERERERERERETKKQTNPCKNTVACKEYFHKYVYNTAWSIRFPVRSPKLQHLDLLPAQKRTKICTVWWMCMQACYSLSTLGQKVWTQLWFTLKVCQQVRTCASLCVHSYVCLCWRTYVYMCMCVCVCVCVFEFVSEYAWFVRFLCAGVCKECGAESYLRR